MVIAFLLLSVAVVLSEGQSCLQRRCSSPESTQCVIHANNCRKARHVVDEPKRRLTKRAGIPLSQCDAPHLTRVSCSNRQYGTNLSSRSAYAAVNNAGRK